MTNYDELLKKWGRERLRASGHKVDESADVRVEFESRWSGGCHTCGWDENLLVVTSGKAEITFDSYSVPTLLAEIMEYAVKSSIE